MPWRARRAICFAKGVLHAGCNLAMKRARYAGTNSGPKTCEISGMSTYSCARWQPGAQIGSALGRGSWREGTPTLPHADIVWWPATFVGSLYHSKTETPTTSSFAPGPVYPAQAAMKMFHGENNVDYKRPNLATEGLSLTRKLNSLGNVWHLFLPLCSH